MLVLRTPVSSGDRMGATDANCRRIVCIDATDALGYRGRGREEHTGENAPIDPDDLPGELADNAAVQIGRRS